MDKSDTAAHPEKTEAVLAGREADPVSRQFMGGMAAALTAEMVNSEEHDADESAESVVVQERLSLPDVSHIDEAELTERYGYGIRARVGAERLHLSNDEQIALILIAQQGSQSESDRRSDMARAILLSSLLPFVEATAQTMLGPQYGYRSEVWANAVSDAMHRLDGTISTLDMAGRYADFTFRAWSLRIIRRAVIDAIRDRRRGEKYGYGYGGDIAEGTTGQVTFSDPERQVIAREELARLTVLVAQLPDELREIIRLVGHEGMTYAEAAAVTGVKEGTLRGRFHRAVHRLRAALESGEPIRRLRDEPGAEVLSADEHQKSPFAPSAAEVGAVPPEAPVAAPLKKKAAGPAFKTPPERFVGPERPGRPFIRFIDDGTIQSGIPENGEAIRTIRLDELDDKGDAGIAVLVLNALMRLAPDETMSDSQLKQLVSARRRRTMMEVVERLQKVCPALRQTPIVMSRRHKYTHVWSLHPATVITDLRSATR
ncbi:sigma-70 family RNA polymerase sigma factor [Candidatus Saccharibacteria bacterium]|nr:sigma-70 family RNA polymerase sigma factor [Candidatus Saccharibacteria bacterium]